MPCPFMGYVYNSYVQLFGKAGIGRKYRFIFDYFARLAVKALNGICSIYCLLHIFEIHILLKLQKNIIRLDLLLTHKRNSIDFTPLHII